MRQITSKLHASGNDIIPVFREPFNIFAGGKADKKECLEPSGEPQKSPKHLEWLPLLSKFYEYLEREASLQ